MKKVALIYHINLSHYSLTSNHKKDYLSRWLGEMINCIKVPVNLSICLEDLQIIKNRNFGVYKQVVNHPMIKFLRSIYSHTLISEFSVDTEMQLKYGAQFEKKLIPNKKLLSFGAFPEYDFPKKKLNIVIKNWQYCLINNNILGHSKYDDCKGIYKLQSDNNIKFICLHHDTGYREFYHLYFREKCSASKVIDSVRSDSRDLFKSLNTNLALLSIDFEVPIFNEVWFSDNQEISLPRIDLFRELQDKLSKSDLEFIHIPMDAVKNKASITNLKSFRKINLEGRTTKESYKVINGILKRRREYLNTNNQLLYLNKTISDNYSFNRKDLILESSYLGRPGRVIIKRNSSSFHLERIDELLYNVVTL